MTGRGGMRSPGLLDEAIEVLELGRGSPEWE